MATANACTTWVTDTSHGVTVTRSVDWGTPLGGIAHLVPKGSQLTSPEFTQYAQSAKWTSRYQVMNIEEYESFHGAAVSAINLDTGMSANGQYMEDSQPFLKQHQDSGAPAVALAQLTSYITGNYANVAEVKQALEQGEFQIAWAGGLAGGEHGVHFSVQDKDNNTLLIQLDEGGEQKLYHNQDDLRSMVNAPLQQYHREYVAGLEMDKPETLTKMSAHISSKERNARLLFLSNNAKLDNSEASWAQTEGKVLGLFDRAVLVPQDIIDPDNGDTYATWVSYVYNFEQASFKFRNHDTYNDVRIDLNELKDAQQPLCADLVEQSNAGYQYAQWSSCELELATH
ncbi:hypothetical protein GCM10007414_28250 [Agarivorans gilvus]|uniref:Choloylglycine hydrolase/NAAA C-terminal domain-containing protein n=2 Tax=Agarivorans gilvus TaxID=680279 RepID=A0ABQ1I5F5_9ALTE|nr:hypothetical protein GCM10007414_28250 [Agarivorans gilvus]